jgi:hypothetical protein
VSIWLLAGFLAIISISAIIIAFRSGRKSDRAAAILALPLFIWIAVQFFDATQHAAPPA